MSHKYLIAVSSIIYAATGMHPDVVAFTVQHLSQFNSNPGPTHWTAVQHVIWYLYATKNTSLMLGGHDIHLTGWVNSDWGSCTDSH